MLKPTIQVCSAHRSPMCRHRQHHQPDCVRLNYNPHKGHCLQSLMHCHCQSAPPLLGSAACRQLCIQHRADRSHMLHYQQYHALILILLKPVIARHFNMHLQRSVTCSALPSLVLAYVHALWSGRKPCPGWQRRWWEVLMLALPTPVLPMTIVRP
jgi:hypothetical protein